MNNKLSRFWKIYLSATVAVVVCIAAGLAIFYDFIREFENAQSVHAAEVYTASLNADIIGNWIANAADDLVLEFDTPRSAAEACRAALSKLNGEFSCQREFASSSENPVYIITCGDVPVGKFTMRENAGGKYGFSSWEVIGGEAILDYLQADNISLCVCVPVGGTLSVNGVEISGNKYISEKVLYPYTSLFEKNAGITAQMYQFDGLYSIPELKCSIDGIECTGELENGVFWFRYPSASFETYTVSAPAGAEVMINGVSVEQKYIKETGIPYKYAAVEASEKSLPCEVKYEITDLLCEPNIQVKLHGENLTVTTDEQHFKAEYPMTQMYTYTLKVPQGSVVTMRGISCETYKSEKQEEAYPGLYSDANYAPLLDIYKLSGLYLPADDIEVFYNNTKYSAAVNRDVLIEVQYPAIENEEVETAVLSFAKDYFTYISGGYNNTEANLARALAHVQKGSALYSSIQRSLIGIQFVTPVSSQKYNLLEVTEMRIMPDGGIYCFVTFDIEQKIYHVSRSYSGSLSLIVQKNGDIWKITEMLTESDN